eukprot:460432-Rhodomonas_salina.2
MASQAHCDWVALLLGRCPTLMMPAPHCRLLRRPSYLPQRALLLRLSLSRLSPTSKSGCTVAPRWHAAGTLPDAEASSPFDAALLFRDHDSAEPPGQERQVVSARR